MKKGQIQIQSQLYPKQLSYAGVAESRWAVEVFEPAADAYKLNNPACTVFKDCCNMLLKNAIDGIPVNAKGQKIPRRGEVTYLYHGPNICKDTKS